ncbi:LuxR family transcriptional regulator [Rhodococcus zopfii]|uniref:LuxR family transcriptional regulator n=1 Tax=Rhodococcus zopfii TaxID=43772 RepID=A0ABU3WRJ6_9NOCA|nr:LuxR family transcriptional regulator [Rhodococcus zopfii]
MTSMLERPVDQENVKPALSAREVEILREWLMSDSKSEVATRLFLAPATVSTHIARIRDKYALVGRVASSKAMLLARALQDGLIDIDEL